MRQLFLFLIAFSFLFTACKDNPESSGDPVYKMEFRLIDSAANYQEVNIDLQDVLYNLENDSLGWVSLMSLPSGVYNLLDFTGGNDTLLGTIFTSSVAKQIRLKLGNNNSIKVDNVTYPLKTPSGQQSGLKLKMDTNLVPGVHYVFWLDFIVEKSVVKTGKGEYILKPVIRLVSSAGSGSIRGVVKPSTNMYSVYAYNTTDTFSTLTNTDGDFLLMGIPQNSYTMRFTSNTSSHDTIINNISVVNGQQTVVDTMKF